MVFGSKLVICVIFTFVQFVTSDTVFSNQYLGNYLSDKEYKSREKCSTRVCLLDADRLIYAATRNGSVKPCDDFKTFAMGEFYLHRKKNDRYGAIGFSPEVSHLSDERYRNVLKLPIKKEDLKVHKFLKSHFRKCTDTDHITKHGVDEILAYLNSLGGSPLIAEENWDETKFDVATLLQLHPLAFNFLAKHKIIRCNVEKYSGQLQNKTEPICLKISPARRHYEIDLLKTLKKFKLDKNKYQKVVGDYKELVNIRFSDYISDYKFDFSEAKFTKIKDLSRSFPHFDINWLKLINDRLFSTSQITEEEEILIEHPDYLNHTLTFLSTIDKGVIANAFTANFLLNKTALIFTHFLDSRDAEYRGTKQSLQRFETCIALPRRFSFKLSLESLLATGKFSKEIQNAAKEFVMEAVADHASEIVEQQTFNDEQMLIKEELIEKLKNVQLQVMFPDEALNGSIVDTFYDGLDFDETMSFFELQLAMESFAYRVDIEKKSSFIKTLHSKVVETVQYKVEENILVVPAKYTLPPVFVSNRSRFFNVATLHSKVHDELSRGIQNYLVRKNKFRVFPVYLSNSYLIDKYYVKWEENGGKELQLSSFKLTNRQMLWLCIANVYAIQYHKKQNLNNNPLSRFQNDNFHINFKQQKRFREAFNCDDLTQQEEDIISEFENLARMRYHG